jgi:hypothetical protein
MAKTSKAISDRQPAENDSLRPIDLGDVDPFEVHIQLRFNHSLLDIHSKSIHITSTMNNIIGLSPKQLRRAADIQEKIQSLQNELNDILGAEASSPVEANEAPKKRKFSAAAKARMKAAQKARWAKIKGTAPSAKPVQKPKQKRKMTKAWRMALERAWAARRAKTKAAKGK